MDALTMLADCTLPSLEGPEGTAELVVAVAHRCADWDVWGGTRSIRYWDALTDRVRTCCYAGPRLADWWDAMVRRMSLHAPPTSTERAALAGALGSGNDRAVLVVLAGNAEALVLRVRVANEQRKTARFEETDKAGENA